MIECRGWFRAQNFTFWVHQGDGRTGGCSDGIEIKGSLLIPAWARCR